MGSMGRAGKEGARLLTGNEAIALGALDAGCRFFGGYPITPSSEVAETMAEELPKRGGVFIQMEDEIAAMSAVIGAALGGVKAITATSGPGFSLKQEAIGYACEAEVPCVIVNIMRGGPSTGMPTLPAQADVMQAKWGTHGDHPTIAFCPERVSEAYMLTQRAFHVAERLRTPVMILADEIVGHVTEKVVFPVAGKVEIFHEPVEAIPAEGYRPFRFSGAFPPPLVPFGKGFRYHVTGLLHDETGFPTNDPERGDHLVKWLCNKVEQHADRLADVELVGIEDAEIILFAYGGTARSAKGALRLARERGLKVGLIRPITIWPFPDKIIEQATRNAKVILAAEMNLGQLAHEVEWAISRRIPVLRFNKVGGDPIVPEELLDVIEEI